MVSKQHGRALPFYTVCGLQRVAQVDVANLLDRFTTVLNQYPEDLATKGGIT
jgi:hypothetical protein